jgi:hypothetical protein
LPPPAPIARTRTSSRTSSAIDAFWVPNGIAPRRASTRRLSRGVSRTAKPASARRRSAGCFRTAGLIGQSTVPTVAGGGSASTW